MSTRVEDGRAEVRSEPVAAFIPRSVLFGSRERTSVALSPDGSRLAWIAISGGVMNVWVRDLDGEDGTERVVTREDRCGAAGFVWGPDATRLLYLRDDAGDENFKLFDVRVATGDVRCLTPFDGTQARMVKVSKRHPGHILVGLNLDDARVHDVYRLDLAGGELVQVCKNPGLVGLLADEELRVRAGLEPLPDGGMAIVVRDSDEAGWRRLLVADYEDAKATQPLAFNLDGTRLLCTTSAGVDTSQLVWLDVATGERVVVASDPSYDVASVSLDPDTNEPTVVFIQGERRYPVVVDERYGGDIARLGAVDGGDLRLLGGSDDGTVWLFATVHDDGPARYYTYQRRTGDVRFLFADQPELEGYRLAAMEPFTVRSRDGLDLHGYLTFPPGLPRNDLPAVVLVHGGPWIRDTWGLDPLAQWLANRGYVCIQTNFRGSTGYGKAFFNAGNRQWANGMHTDLLDALAWTVEEGWVDPGRMGIFGASYGGYAALVGATFTPDVFACAVAWAPPSNLATLITSMPAYWKPMIAQAHLRIGHPDTDRDLLWSRSPLSRVDQIRMPLLIAHGGNDPRVPKTECEQILNALNENGIPHEYLFFADEGHGVVKPANVERLFAATERFLGEHLGGVVQKTKTVTTTDPVDDGALDAGPLVRARGAR